jgi:hypothetical protein
MIVYGVLAEVSIGKHVHRRRHPGLIIALRLRRDDLGLCAPSSPTAS